MSIALKTAQEYLDLAAERLGNAHRILAITYPALKSPRLFLSALEHLFLSMDYSMNALLSNEKNLRKFPMTFSGRYSTFRVKVAGKYGIGRVGTQSLIAMRDILLEHQKSPVEFERNEKFIICSGNYRMIALTMEILLYYEGQAEGFLRSAQGGILAEPLSRS